MRLTVFTDELMADIDRSLDIVKGWGGEYVDFRGLVNGKAIEFQTESELRALKARLDGMGLKTAAIESSLCKLHLPDEAARAKEEEKLEGLIRAADILDCRLIRAFNYWQPYNDASAAGQLGVRPDLMSQVMTMFKPIADRAKRENLILAFENCGQTAAEVFALLDALGVPEWGLAWDPYNEISAFEAGSDAEYKYLSDCLSRSLLLHVKAGSVLTNDLPEKDVHGVPWRRILNALKASGKDAPVSIETHNPQGSPFTNEDATRRCFEYIRSLMSTGYAHTVAEALNDRCYFERSYKDDPVRFVQVGLGVGAGRARQIMNTEGCKLYGVCDTDGDKARRIGEELGVPYSTDINEFLKDENVEVMYTTVPTGLHASVSEQCLLAGKHVLTTKPMDANADNCRRLINTARATGKMLGVDFDLRVDNNNLALKKAVDAGWFGRILAVHSSLFVRRTQDYYDENGAWRGTWALDGGGAMSNQGIHEIDRLQFLFGVPKRVRSVIYTQCHDIEAEDIGFAEWDYGNELLVRFFSTTNYPLDAWTTKLEIIGSEGAYSATGGGPDGSSAYYGKDGKWTKEAPYKTEREWKHAADSFASAVRKGTPFSAYMDEGLRSRAILDCMYVSAKNGGEWANVII